MHRDSNRSNALSLGKIRVARPGDVLHFARILVEDACADGRQAPGIVVAESSLTKVLRTLEDAPDSKLINLVYEKENQVAGYLIAVQLRGLCHLYDIRVRPIHRQCGIAVTLLAEMVNCMDNCKSEPVIAHTHEHDSYAQEFLRHHFFELIGSTYMLNQDLESLSDSLLHVYAAIPVECTRKRAVELTLGVNPDFVPTE